MSQNKYTRPDSSTQASTAYKANIDNGFETFESGVGTNFQAHEQTTPDMTVRIEAGVIYDHSNSTRTEYAAASTGTITAPSTQGRIDLISIHQATGVLTVTTGTESSSPSAPALPASNFPIAKVTLSTSTTQITNSLITDIRVPFTIGGGASGLTDLVDDTTPQLGGNLDLQGYDIIDTNGNEILEFTAAASAINHVRIKNAATGVGPTIEAAGDNSNVDLNIKSKGTGKVALGTGGLKFPNSDGSSGDVLTTNGSGTLSFSTPSVGISADAYVQFTIGASPTINVQSNVASVTNNGSGKFTITFTSAVSSANYLVFGHHINSFDSFSDIIISSNDHTTADLIIYARDNGGTAATNGTKISVLVFGA